MEDLLIITTTEDPRDLFKEHLKKYGPVVSHFARLIGIAPKTLHAILNKERTLQDYQRQKLNEVLNTNF